MLTQSDQRALLTVGAVLVAAWWLHRRGTMGQIGPWFPEDPTGGAYQGGGDPIYGDPLGPGESIAVAYQWLGQSKPRGFTAVSAP